jgi:hypothetical protein
MADSVAPASHCSMRRKEKTMERFEENFEPLPASAVEGGDGRFRIEIVLKKCGIDEATVDSVRRRMADVDVQELVKKFRRYAKENPAVVLGALCALAVGGTLVAERVTRKSRTRERSATTRSTTTRSTKRASSKRTLIEPHKGDKRHVRRDAKGRIKESVHVGRSLAADRRRHSKSTSKSGQGDKGDR